MRSRKQAADATREAGLATVEQLGSDFTSITQTPATVPRDLDQETDRALHPCAEDNLDRRPAAPNDATSLMMNIPAVFTRKHLRLAQGKVGPEEYDRLARP